VSHEPREKGLARSHVGMPAGIYLDHFGIEVYEAFGDFPYLVGSALRTTAWRDVDVRLILADEDFERQIGSLERPHCLNLKWNALCLAWSALGARMTGLPVDFQIDQRSEANNKHKGPRHPLGHHLWMRRREEARAS
jgi:hypothetical protein